MTPDHDIDTEYTYEPERWHRPAKQATADASLIDRLHTAEAKVEVLSVELRALNQVNAENIKLRQWVTALVGSWPPLGDNYECLYCRHTRYLCDPANHEPDCPWRVAAEYIQSLEIQHD